jgi:exopolysaccharide production protein ExoZ
VTEADKNNQSGWKTAHRMGEQDRLIGLQIGRGLAALSIAYYHSWVALNRFPEGTAYPLPVLTGYGWIAVDVFFAISGFVICLVTAQPNFNVVSFLIKRSFRLYPLWWLTLCVFAAVAVVWRGFKPVETVGYFLYSGTLLPTKEFPFYDLGWTLQHEMAFYLLAAVVIPRFGARGLAVFLASSTAVYHLVELPWVFATLASYHAHFLAGVLAYLAKSQLKRFGFWIPFAIGMALLWLFATQTSSRTLFPFALFFLIVAFINVRLDEDAWWTKSLVALGDASYSIYLIHPIVFLLVSAAASRFLAQLPLWTEEPIRAASLAVVIAFSLLSWRFFEKPLIAVGNRLAAKKILVAAPSRKTA